MKVQYQILIIGNLLSIDDIQDVINELIKKRYNELPKANEKIEEKILDFTSWFNQYYKVTPTIANLKHHYESIQKKRLIKYPINMMKIPLML